MWEGRARGARRDIAALVGAGIGVAELHTAAIDIVRQVVPCELTCWAAIDPDTMVISSMISGAERIPPEYEPSLAEAEYAGTERHSFAELATRPFPVARLSDLPYREAVGHRRLNEVWRPLGLDHEVRVAFCVEGTCWGAAGIVRSGAEFTDREVEFLGSVSPVLAAATRLAVRTDTGGYPPDAGPAIVLTDPRGEPTAITPAARFWRAELDDVAPGRFGVLLRAVVTGALAAPSGTFRAHVRAAAGWAVLRASRMIAAADDGELVAVTIEPATGHHLAGMLFRAYDLTAREREICREVMAGYSTAGIADRLSISPHTVQDHLKSVFAKVGVGSRGELVARLWPKGIGDS